MYRYSTQVLSLLNMGLKHAFLKRKKMFIGSQHAAKLYLIRALKMISANWNKWHTRCRPLPYLCWIFTRNLTGANGWNSCIGPWYAAGMCLIWASNMTSANWRNSSICLWDRGYLCWICSRNMTRAKWWNSGVSARPTSYRWRNSSRNMTYAKWWDSIILARHLA